MKYIVSSSVIISPWIPGILNPERRGHYERNRITRTPRPSEYWAPNDWEHFIAMYSPPSNTAPLVGSALDLEYWDGSKWWLSTDRRTMLIESYSGPGKEKHYWRGIEFDEAFHTRPAALPEGEILFEW